MKIVFIFNIVFLLSSTLFADFGVRICPNKKSALSFANGMFTTIDSATLTLETFKSNGPRHDKYFLAYNKDENLIIQAHEVFSQKIASEMISEKSFLELMLKGNMTSIFRRRAAKSLQFLFNLKINYDNDLKEHIDSYKKNLEAGYRIHVIAHSQGNFYANQAYDYLNSNLNNKITAFRITSIANPDRRVGGNGNYFTYSNDLVIKYLPYALTANATRKHSDGSNHGIIDAYYRYDELLDQINSRIVEVENETRNRVSYTKKEKDNIQFYRDSVMIECQRWFLSYVKLTSKNDFGSCTLQCLSTSYIDFGFFHCPLQCEALCCTREFQPWPFPVVYEDL